MHISESLLTTIPYLYKTYDLLHNVTVNNLLSSFLLSIYSLRFTGSYTDVEKKDFADFFLGLTGGYAMKYELRIPTHDSEKVYFKFKDILASGSFIFCLVKINFCFCYT